MDNTDRADPYEHLATRHQWTRIMRRTRFGSRSKTREIGMLLASYGNTDGTNCYAGVRRLAAAGECDEKTVQRSLHKLRSLGLITLVESGSHNGRPKKGERSRNDKYILTVPPDVEERIPMLPASELDPERELELKEERRVDAARRRENRRIEREAAKGSSKGSAEGSPNPREDSTKTPANPEYQGTVAAYQETVRPVSGDISAGIRGHLTPRKRGLTCEDDAYQIVRPVSRDQESSHHPASVKRPSAGALGARDDDQQDTRQDNPTDLDAEFQSIANEVGNNLTDGEASKVRGLLRRGTPREEIITVLEFVRGLSAA